MILEARKLIHKSRGYLRSPYVNKKIIYYLKHVVQLWSEIYVLN